MFKHYLLLALFTFGFLANLPAQITITNATFPQLGDTLSFAYDIQPDNIIITPPGGNQSWDYTDLRAIYTQRQVFKDPSTGVANAAFPSAKLLSENNSIENYYNVTNQALLLLGYYGADPIGLGINLVSKYNPPIVERRAPMQFFDVNSLNSGLLLPFSKNVLPDTVLQLLPFIPDSLRIRIAINRIDVVDAWGNLAIPGGNYAVLREKRTTYREARLDAKIGFLGWQDVTEVARQALGLNSLGVDTTTAYHFFSNTAKEPIAIIMMNNIGTQVTSVQYKLNPITTDVTKIGLETPDLAAFPNPASGKVHFRFNNIKPGKYFLKIYNVLGMEVWSQSYEIGGKQFDTAVDISKLETGTYLYQWVDRKGISLASKQLIIRNP